MKEITEIVKKYIETPNTYGAIMITSDWGTGKSYYLNNALIPFIKSNIKYNSIVVSLHGLKNSCEISKAVYFEYLASKNKALKKLKGISKNKKGLIEHTKLAAKTIVRGVTSYFNINLECSEKDLDKLFNSIDLSSTVLIFEDLERSSMTPFEVLSFVNNLTEYDNVKVVLIANEKELERINKSLPEQNDYSRIKEKTIYDTIVFSQDTENAIKEILMEYEFSRYCGDLVYLTKIIIEDIIKPVKCNNLRSFIYACNKMEEMYKLINAELYFEFLREMFLGVVAYCLKYKRGDNLNWPQGKYDSSSELGTAKHPLLIQCYLYVNSNIFIPKYIISICNDYIHEKQEMKNKEKLRERMNVLYNFYVSNEKDVRAAVDYVASIIDKPNTIPPSEYERLGNYLIAVKYTILDTAELIDKCLTEMINNLNSLTKKESEKIHFIGGGIVLDDSKASDDFLKFDQEINAIVKRNKMKLNEFSYEKGDVADFCDRVSKSRDTFAIKQSFAADIIIDEFLMMLTSCNAEQLLNIRMAFMNVYDNHNVKDSFPNDMDNLKKIIDYIEDYTLHNDIDAIQKKQLISFKNYLLSLLNNNDYE